jgi:hypothetical protein
MKYYFYTYLVYKAGAEINNPAGVGDGIATANNGVNMSNFVNELKEVLRQKETYPDNFTIIITALNPL